MRTLLAGCVLLFSLSAAAAEVDQTAAVQALAEPKTLLIDVRTAEEFAEGALPGASRIGYEQIDTQIASLTSDKDTPIVLYCRSGRRSGIAQDELRKLGYTHVINAGGYQELKTALALED
ncbi:rhodanese-like domain-containing protein [Pseudomonas cavernicola]|uniref:Rhodanese-like domain-containing protein n=1 Tax=Pseudomonas cavernicola TaxID=2320866 RepID=A0A418XLU4_9PSED|nr:rhodanese-like domain-containing protein [Pseudomonas cavernicola]RJG13442.1 rhodanese-like domain-containing protein [Pseudomonas cavernicola]